jgi:hypothetical protein
LSGIENPALAGAWAEIGAIVAAGAGIFGIIAYFDRKVAAVKADLCNESKEVKVIVNAIATRVDETLVKLNEHLIVSAQAIVELRHLRELLDQQNDEIEKLRDRD